MGVHLELHEPLPGRGAEPWAFSREPGRPAASAPPHPALASDTTHLSAIIGFGSWPSGWGSTPFDHELGERAGATGTCRSNDTPCRPHTRGKHSQLLT